MNYCVRFFDCDDEEQYIAELKTKEQPIIPQMNSTVYIGTIAKNREMIEEYDDVPLTVKEIRYGYFKNDILVEIILC